MAGVTMAVVAIGGPPTPLIHLYYFVVLSAALLWGPWWGILVGGVCGALGGPGAQALAHVARPGELEWPVRCGAMMLVGGACGMLTRSLMARLHDLETLNRETIAAFVRAIDARDPYTAQHSERVAAYSAALAEALGLDAKGVERIRLTALLHDVGKVGLERSVLQKPGSLNEEEWREVRAHPTLSAHILTGVGRFGPYLDGARHHHERYDGRGYPDGLAGEDIPFDARIIAVADAYEAMTANRAYRAACSHEEALRRIADGSGTQFDPRCAAAFMALEIHRQRLRQTPCAPAPSPAPAVAPTSAQPSPAAV
jgi:HD domain